MSGPERNKRIVLAFVDAFNGQDWEAIDRLVSPEFIRHSGADTRLGGARQDIEYRPAAWRRTDAKGAP